MWKKIYALICARVNGAHNEREFISRHGWKYLHKIQNTPFCKSTSYLLNIHSIRCRVHSEVPAYIKNAFLTKGRRQRIQKLGSKQA